MSREQRARRNRRALAATLAVAAVAALVASVAGLAFWTASGSATVTASVGRLEPATIEASVSRSGTVTIDWVAPAIAVPASGTPPVTYTVERRLGAGAFEAVASGPCAGSLPSATGSCDDTVGVAGTYAYRVVARLSSSWTAVSNLATAVVAFDVSPPETAVTFPADGALLGAIAYGAGCVPAGVCGGATDASGVARVRVSVRRDGGGYWTGTGFDGFSEYLLDAALTTPGAPSTAWGLPLPLPPDGRYAIRVTALDTVGNDSAPAATATAVFAIDTRGPETAVTTTPAGPDGQNGWFRRPSVELALSASDPAPGSGVASTTFALDGGPDQLYTGPVALTAQGEHVVRFRSVDGAGNLGPEGTARIALDDAAPTTSLALTPASPDGGNGWYRTAPAFTLTAADAASGVAETWYRVDGGPATAYPGGPVALSEGRHSVAYWSVDEAGNVEATRTSAQIAFDATAPSTTLATQPPAPDGANGWFRQSSVTFTLGASDALSGVGSRLYRLDGGAPQVYTAPVAISSPGAHVVEYWSVDEAGNAGVPIAADVELDAVAPTTTLTTTPGAPDGSAGWFRRTSVTLTFAASDATSGVAATAYTVDGGPAEAVTGPVALDTQGQHVVTYWSTDVAGNVETARTATVKLDGVAPTVTLSTTPASADGADGWFRTGVAFTLTASDASSGVASRLYRIDGGAPQGYTGQVTLAQGDHTVEYWAVDDAGNASTPSTQRIKLDTVAPSTTLATVPGVPDGANGWFRRASVAFTLTSTDALSGVAARFYTIDGGAPQAYAGTVTITAQGDHNVSFWATDKAGNVESARSTRVKLDDVAPAVSVSLTAAGSAVLSGSTIVYKANATSANRTFRLRATVADAASGPASASYPLLSASGWSHAGEGPVTSPGGGVYDSSPFTWSSGSASPSGYTFTVADQAGNTASTTLTFASDVTPPTGTLTLGPSPVGALLAGTTLYVRTGAAGSFTMVDSVTDTGSGPASASFPAVTTSGWSHAAETVTAGTGTQPTIAYASTQYAWAAGAGSPSSTTVTSADRVGNSSQSTLAVVADNTGPTGGALRVNGVDATGAGSVSTDGDGTFALGPRTDYGADAGSGFASSVLTRQQATLTGDSCGTFGDPTTISGTPAQAGLADGCYRYTLTGTDRLGNTSSIATTVKVESPPVVTLDSVTDGGGHRELFNGTTSKLSGTITIQVTWAGFVVQTYTFAATASPWTFESDVWDLLMGVTYTARVRQVDAAGNSSGWSDPFTFVAF